MRGRPNQRKPPRKRSVNLYIHFPYCLYKCHYCDFSSFAIPSHQIPHQDYLQALQREWANRVALYEKDKSHFYPPGLEVESIFFGGGTPSLMHPHHVGTMLETISNYFVVHPHTEITLEANPGTLTLQKLKDFKAAGVNRISLGVQSFQDSNLRAYGRIHSGEEARHAVEMVGELFSNWSADLMFGFPGQGFEGWRQDLETLLAFDPPHLSCYAFTVEEGTIYALEVKKGKPAPDADLQALMFEWNINILQDHGFKAYEISNFSKENHNSLHNLNYWNYGSYVGLGAGAVSFLPADQEELYGIRTTNYKSPTQYREGLAKGRWFESEKISEVTAMGEWMMMGLRLAHGVDWNRFEKKFPMHPFVPILQKYRDQEWMEQDRVALTPQGRLFANQVMADFLGPVLTWRA